MNIRPTQEFAHQVAMITGATSGVGCCIAQMLAARAAEVALVGRRLDALRSVAERCAQFGVKTKWYQADLCHGTEIDELKDRVLKDFGGVDILVHSAGTITLSSLAEAALEAFDEQYQCNVRAPFALTQALLASLIARQGQIVFLNSTAGLQALNGVSQYAATKHALKAIADSLREEVNDRGVRVLNVFLGRTATPMQARIHEVEGRGYHPEELIQPEQVATVVANALALGREAEITEIRMRPMRKPGALVKK